MAYAPLELAEARCDDSGFEEKFCEAIQNVHRPFRTIASVAETMRKLIDAGLANPPLPGSGQTLDRWRTLATIAGYDLSLAKIYEGHTDALAIIAELHGVPSEGLWAVWAAEPPQARLIYYPSEKGGEVTGRKAWCSGAAVVDEAVISAWTENGRPILVQVDLRQPGVVVENKGWQAVGMSASESISVVFTKARAHALGQEGQYVDRPGFWQGGAGIAAVWYGGAVAIAQTLADSTRVSGDSHAAAHLGALDVALRSAKALLIESAEWIDAHPTSDASAIALRVRACVEATANEVLLRVGRALGPGPLCTDAIHAQRCADLPVFLRQSHAEHDLEALGRTVAEHSPSWDL